MDDPTRGPRQPWLANCCGWHTWRICCCGLFCLPVLYGKTVVRTRGEGSCILPCLMYLLCPLVSCCFAGMHRTEVRDMYHLRETPMTDCCIHCMCCSPCAVCQEAHELEERAKLPPPVHEELQPPPGMRKYGRPPQPGAPGAVIMAPQQSLAFTRNQ